MASCRNAWLLAAALSLMAWRASADIAPPSVTPCARLPQGARCYEAGAVAGICSGRLCQTVAPAAPLTSGRGSESTERAPPRSAQEPPRAGCATGAHTSASEDVVPWSVLPLLLACVALRRPLRFASRR